MLKFLIYVKNVDVNQCCAAEIIYFRLRLQLQPYYSIPVCTYCHSKLFYNSSTIPIELEISFSSYSSLQTDYSK